MFNVVEESASCTTFAVAESITSKYASVDVQEIPIIISFVFPNNPVAGTIFVEFFEYKKDIKLALSVT